MSASFGEQFAQSRGTENPAWLRKIQEQGWQQFETLGIPTSKNENWKYTSVKSIFETPWQSGVDYQPQQSTVDELQCLRFSTTEGLKLTFVNGSFAPSLSHLEGLPKGMVIQSMGQAIQEHPQILQKYLNQVAPIDTEPFVGLNAAFLKDGAFIHIPKGTVLEQPIELEYLSLSNGHPAVCHPRNLILVEEHAQASVIETYAGKPSSNQYFTNAVTEIFLKPGAVLHHYKVQDECESAQHLSSTGVHQEKNSNFTSCNISIGGSLSRNHLLTRLLDEGAECSLHGLYMAHGKQHMDNQTFIDHAKPHCTSRELYKGILDDSAQGVFNGQIKVHPDAQKTISSLTNNNLLLSQEALINTKPLLEILADDVKCSHGVTIGRLDKTQIFYLRSRGLDLKMARHLLTYAFASEIIQELKVPSLKAHLEEILLNRLRIPELSVEGMV